MNYTRRFSIAALVLVLGGLGACASFPENAITSPEVELRDIEVVGLGFSAQTLLLSFDIRNPNPFPLPLNHVKYGVKIDGQRLASGDTPCGITVPAGGDAEFAISVELDLLSTAPQLLTILRKRGSSEIPYELKGELGIDIPLTPTVSYRTDGSIRLN